VTSFEYDALGRTTALIDAQAQRYRFNYDAVGQLRHVRRGTTMMSFTYDAVGNRKHRTDYNGTLTIYDYDALNRLKTINYPDTTTVNYTYDKLSRLQTATNQNGVVNFDYNRMNRMTSVTDIFGQAVDYNYDLNGNRTKLSLNGAVVETYRYDAIDRLTKILDAASASFNFTYDPTSKLTSLKAPNGITATYQYDGLDRLTRLTNKKGQATVADFQYQLNDANNISQIADLASTNNYSYDAVDRLAAATHSNQPNESYGYDGVGNRTSSNLSAGYGYQPFNRLVSTASATYNYDANGNLIAKTDASGTTQYVWDFENRLKQVTLPNGKVVTYKYDALGRRVERSASVVPPLPLTTTEHYIYDGADVIRDTDGNGITLADYLNGPGIDNKLRQTTATASLYFVQDHLGSTRALTDAAGNVVEQQQYDSFGNSSGSSRTRYGHTGRERDPDTGLLYYRARFYDPQLGRFISEDPIGLGGGINSFVYVNNNATNAKDPSGLYEIDVHYYLTYYSALKTGCFSEPEAREIANADQGMDENPATAPAWGNTPRQRDANAFYHALHPGSHLPYLQTHWAMASMGPRGNLPGLGGFLHYRQDMYSHDGFTDPELGHSPFHLGSHNNDKTSHDVSKAMAMARATWDSLMDFAIQTGRCRCRKEPDSNMWKTVQEFAEASGGGPWDRHYYSIDEINPAVLNNKIRILGLSRR
jgi:RHS repeat-associated protein